MTCCRPLSVQPPRRVNGAIGLTPQRTSRCVSTKDMVHVILLALQASRCVSTKDTVHVILLALQASRCSGMILGLRLPVHDGLPVYYQ